MPAGEQRAWGILAGLDPHDVCVRADAAFDSSSGLYILRSFSQDIFVSPGDKTIFGHTPPADMLLNKLNRYSRLPILWYLIGAQNVPLSGELIKPNSLSGGQIYEKGTHVLPLGRIAEEYGSDVPEFLSRGLELGGEPLRYGDASVQLFPFPRVAVTLLLWRGDGEFPSRTDLLLDSTCELHLPADIIWSTAMMCALVML